MNPANPLVFPDLIYMNEYDGNFQTYFGAVYGIFEQDFIKKTPKFQGMRVATQKFPLVDGTIHRTFYHITHEGSDEQNRTPDIRRMERIRFPRFIITCCPHQELLIWKNIRGRDTRILIWNKEEEYLTVLTERKGFVLLWTAYHTVENHTKRKLENEYNTYIKSQNRTA